MIKIFRKETLSRIYFIHSMNKNVYYFRFVHLPTKLSSNLGLSINFALMNSNLLKTEVQKFLKDNLTVDHREIALKKSPFPKVSSLELAQQIKGLQISKTKFPFLFETDHIIFPPQINLEQASSIATAEYKASLVQGDSLIDLTAGMGIDAYAFSKKFNWVVAVEKNEKLVKISKHNYKTLQQNNLKYINSDFEKTLNENPNANWDVIYLDPARRKNAKKKFLLEDLEPNILNYIDNLTQRSKIVMIKLSPLFDLKMAIQKIPQIQEIHLVAVKNEMKELLLICQNKIQENPQIHAVNLRSNHPKFSFKLNDESQAKVQFSDFKKYIYEPNSAIMKSGAFQFIAEKFELYKLEKNTHLYTSDQLIKDFPGRIFECLEEIKNPKKTLKNTAFHIISKNHPLSVEDIRKKFNIKESENSSLIFTQGIVGKKIIKCKKVEHFDSENSLYHQRFPQLPIK